MNGMRYARRTASRTASTAAAVSVLVASPGARRSCWVLGRLGNGVRELHDLQAINPDLPAEEVNRWSGLQHRARRVIGVSDDISILQSTRRPDAFSPPASGCWFDRNTAVLCCRRFASAVDFSAAGDEFSRWAESLCL
jgi:hypothetical protein